MVFTLALLTLAAARLSVDLSGDHPAVKIIALVQKLQAQVKEEGAEDTHLYGKFTYWCDETTKLKKKAIAEFEEVIDVSKSTIEALEADIETLNLEIAQLSKEIEQMEEARTNATNIRDAEHDVYMKSKTELTETIQSIKDCIEAMKTGMEGGFIQAKTLIEAWGYMPDKHSRVFAQFLAKKEVPTSEEGAAKYEGRGGGDATYVAKGGDVTEILKKMLMEYEDDLVALDKSEAETQAAYLLADDAKRMAIEAATKTKKTKEKVLGEKGQELANTQADLKEAEDGFLADTTVLKETVTTCKKREDQYNQHMKTREGELEAMTQAIEILEKVTGVRSPESKGVSPTAVIPDFTQLRSVHLRKYKDPKAAVVAVLRKAGKSKATAALSKLADKISALKQMPGSGMFDSIKNMIQKMIFHLMDEQKNEDEHKHWCDKEITNTDLMITEKTEKKADAEATITQLAEKIQDLKNGITSNQDAVALAEKEISDRTADRADEKAENEATIKDAEDAQSAVAEAIAVLTTFYKNSGEVQKEAWESFVQVRRHKNEPGETAPEPELYGEDEVYTGTEGGASVIGMLEKVATDFAEMESQARADETEQQDEFDAWLTATHMDKAEKTKDTDMKNSRKGRYEDKKSGQEESLEHTTKELESTEQYEQDLQKACVDGDSSYAARKDARTQEISALREAQDILEKAFTEEE
jgi:hypothetical protein